MNLAVIIPAAGASRRFAQDSDLGLPGRSKLDEELGGRPVLQRTVELFQNVPAVSTIIVAGPADPAAMAAFREKYSDKLGLLGVKLCAGGATHRYETVRNALALVPAGATHIAVHDAARPCCPLDLIERVLEAAERFPAVIPAIPVADTLKRVTAGEIADEAPDPLAAILGGVKKPGFRAVEATIDRANLMAVQTPQVFARELLLRAYQQKDLASTDDAQLVERLGERVTVVRGDPRNIKITHASDMPLARLFLGVSAPAEKPAHRRF